MGAGQSTAAVLGVPQEQLLQRLAGQEPIPHADAFWDSLFSLPTPLAAMDPEEVELTLAPHCRQLLVHNPLTRNFQSLLLHVMELLAAAQGGAPSLPAANALHLATAVLKVTAELAAPSTLAALFEVGPNMPAAHQGQSSLAPMFFNRVISLLVNCKPTTDEVCYLLVVEALKLLVVAASTQLYSTTTTAPPDAHPLAEAVMDQGDAAPALVSALLALAADRPMPPPRLQLHRRPDGGGYAVVRLVRSAAATVFWIPMRTFQLLRPHGGPAAGKAGAAAGVGGGGGPGPVGTGSPISDLALLSLLLLAHFPAQHTGRSNCVRDALANLQDLQLPAAAGGAPPLATPRVPSASFAKLYAFFSTGPPSEASTLLLYTLLHGSRSFREYVLVRSDVETLLLPVLEALYSATRAHANHLYMLQIIILILSQDTSFSHNIHKISLPSVPWYRERSLGRISLGSLVFAVLLRTAMQNFGQLRDLYLPTNTLAALANLAPQVTALHPHAAQRLVALAAALAKRYLRVVRRLEGLGPPGSNGIVTAAAAADGGGADPQQQEETREQLMQDEEVLAGFLRIVLEVINAVLSSALPRNPELVYAVLHRQDTFAALKPHPKLRELVDNIQAVVDFFNSRLDSVTTAGAKGGGGKGAAAEGLSTAVRPQSSQPDWSVREVLELVQSFAAGWRPERLRPLAEMRFVYEEEAAPEEFFVPFIWSLAVGATNGATLHWDLNAVALLTPLVGVSADGGPEHQQSLASNWSDEGGHGGGQLA